MRVLTWHVHGSYLRYLAHVDAEFFLPTRPGRPEGYGGRAGHDGWPANVIEVPAAEVPALDVDVVLYQSRRNWGEDRFSLLTSQQRALPALYLEHDPPREHPTDTRHPAADSRVLIVHVTHFNALMWECGSARSIVIEHGVPTPEVEARYAHPRGIVVVNDLFSRGRRLGLDVFERARNALPLDLVGMGSEALGGLGERSPAELRALMADYSFFFHPARYTSLGLAVLEAMALGLPIFGLATTELVRVIEDGESGYIDTDVDALIARVAAVLESPAELRRMGAHARHVARERFGIERFAADWERAFALAASGATAPTSRVEHLRG